MEIPRVYNIDELFCRASSSPHSFGIGSSSSPSQWINTQKMKYDIDINCFQDLPFVQPWKEEFIRPPITSSPAEVDINNERNDVVNAEQNTPVYCSDEARMIHQNTRSSSGTGALNNGQETMQPDSSNQQQIAEVVDINNQRNVVNAKQNNTPVFCSDEAITREKIESHYGKRQKDVAHILGVSISKFKRKRKECGIAEWPRSKRNKINDSPSRQDPDLPADKPVASLVTRPPKVREITIKATCGEDMIKFRLPFSSRMVELEEEVTQCLKLNVGTYKIKYVDDDGDRILLTRDKDLLACMSDSKSLGTNTIKMFIEPNTKNLF